MINKEENRVTGRTTRLVDKAVQDIFNNPNLYIIIEDHFDHPAAHRELFNRVKNRLESEHGRFNFIFDIKNLRIKIDLTNKIKKN